MGRERNTLLRHMAVAAAYAAVFLAVRPFSDAHWVLTAGLRLSCLLLVPYRYWPALALGELGPQSYFSFQCLEQFGLTYTLLLSIPFTLFAMPIVWQCRERLALFPSPKRISMGALLLCTTLVSIAWAAANYGMVATAHLPAGSPPYILKSIRIVQFFIGNYVGILTVVPLVLLASIELRGNALRPQLRKLFDSRLLLDCTVLLLPILTMLAWLDINSNGDIKQVAGMAMFLPVAWLVLKHGWRAAALGGTMGIAFTCLTLASSVDPHILLAQSFVAFAVTSLLALGARISVQNQQEEEARLDGKRALHLAQQNFFVTELRMRRIASSMEQVGHALQQSHWRLLNRVKRYFPVADERSFSRQATLTQQQVFQLADSVYPQVLRERGLPAALHREGPIARALDEASIAYRCEFQGRGLSQLSSEVHIALYRLACEAIVQVCAHMGCTGITVRLRGGVTRGHRWAALLVSGSRDELAGELTAGRREQLAFRLGANALGLDAIRDHAGIYGGIVHARSTTNSARITILLHDTAEADQAAEATDLRLRVR